LAYILIVERTGGGKRRTLNGSEGENCIIWKFDSLLELLRAAECLKEERIAAFSERDRIISDPREAEHLVRGMCG
jgi:hypothetical protein